jgi:hypothetical protein
MLKVFTVAAALSGLLLAAPIQKGMAIDAFQKYSYEDQYEKTLSIPQDTLAIIISYEKNTGAMVNEMLKERGQLFLDAHRVCFIAEISGMPSVITTMFALPKMRKYPHRIHLSYDETFADTFTPQKDKVTVVLFDKNSKVRDVVYVSTRDELEQALMQ